MAVRADLRAACCPEQSSSRHLHRYFHTGAGLCRRQAPARPLLLFRQGLPPGLQHRRSGQHRVRLGRALAALEVLSALSDAFQREYLSSVEISQGIYYNELEKLCLKHGYTKEDNTMKGILIEPGKGPWSPPCRIRCRALKHGWAGTLTRNISPARCHPDAQCRRPGAEPHLARRGSLRHSSVLRLARRPLQPLNKALQAELLDRLKDTEVRV